jgi:hypothetical protein
MQLLIAAVLAATLYHVEPARGGDGERHLAVAQNRRAVPWHFRGDARRQGRGIEDGDRANAGTPREQCVAELLDGQAERRDDAHAGHRHAVPHVTSHALLAARPRSRTSWVSAPRAAASTPPSATSHSTSATSLSFSRPRSTATPSPCSASPPTPSARSIRCSPSGSCRTCRLDEIDVAADGVAVADVERQHDRAGQRIRLSPHVHTHPRPRLGAGDRDRPADASTRAGDDDPFAFKHSRSSTRSTHSARRMIERHVEKG